jgi:hypothetical protein
MTDWARSIAILAIAPALGAAIFGFVYRVSFRREATEARNLEAAYATQELASRLVVCADRGRFDAKDDKPRALPPTSKKVPSSLPRDAWVATSPSDWDDPAFRCADFRLIEPQPFQIQWELYAKPTKEWMTVEGVVRAEADLDGDGAVDHVVETHVGCAKDMCMVGPSPEIRTLR